MVVADLNLHAVTYQRNRHLVEPELAINYMTTAAPTTLLSAVAEIHLSPLLVYA